MHNSMQVARMASQMAESQDGASLYDESVAPIFFYNENKDFGCFSNFSRHPVEIKGLVWPTTEHYFQVRS